MTEKYSAYLAALAQANQAAAAWGGLALVMVLAWAGLPTLPTLWQKRLRPLYLVGGGLALALALVVSYIRF